MFAAFCAYRLKPEQRVLEFQSVNDANDGQAVLQTTRFDLGVYEDVRRLPLDPDELTEVVTGSLQLLNAGLGVEEDSSEEGKAAETPTMEILTPASNLTLDASNPSSPPTTESVTNDSPSLPGPSSSSA